MQPNLKNQKELVRRVKENGKIHREIMKYKLSVDGEEVGNMVCERLSEYEADQIVKDFGKYHGISTAGIKIDRVVKKADCFRILHLGKVI